MTHPLEAVACHLEVSGCWQKADAPTRLALQRMADLVRAAIPDCECGELVRRELAMDGHYRSISFTRRDAGTDAERVLIYGTDAKRIPFIEEPTKTLSAAVAAARKAT